MQNVKAPVSAAFRSSRTAATALLFVLSAPVLAATGLDVNCDRSAEHVDTHAVDDLSIDTIDHSLTSRITGEKEAGGGDAEGALLPIAASEQEILRRIFDESVTSVDDDPAEAAEDSDAPLIEERSADIADTDALEQEAGDGLLPGIRLPDATAEQMHRYRRQMFRTDI